LVCCAGGFGHWAQWSTPCSNVASGLDPRQWRALREAAAPTVPRPQLLMGTLGLHGKAKQLRAAWKDRCIKHPACDYVSYKTLSDANHTHFGHELVDPDTDSWPRLWTSMLNATFCMQPYGDSPTRKSTADSILLGCIPVLSDPEQAHVWTWQVGWHWSNFSIMHPSPVGLIERLQQVPAKEITRLRRGAALVAAHMAYMYDEGHADAVETVLGGALRVARNRELIVDDIWGKEDWRAAEEVARFRAHFCKTHRTHSMGYPMCSAHYNATR